MNASRFLLAGALAAAGAGLAAGAAAGQPIGLAPITLKDVFDAGPSRSPRSFAWSPDGTRLAWLQPGGSAGEGAVTRLHIRSARDGRTATVPGDLSFGAFAWSRTGGALAVVSEGDLHLVEISASGEPSAPRRLTSTGEEESDPKFSPDGRLIGFVRRADLHVIDPASGNERPLTQGGDPDEVLNGAIDWVYEEELDISSGWWWSPDSRRVAYLQLDQRDVPRFPIVDWIPVHPGIEWQRYPKAGDPNPKPRVGVVEAPAPADFSAPAPGSGAEAPSPPATRWLDLGPDADIYIPRVAWTPGSRVAVQRLHRAQENLDLLVCDPESGACRTILRESDPHWINVADDWHFLEGTGEGRAAGARTPGFVWGSERDGFRHLYVHDMEGGLVRRLTQGPWVVTGLADVDQRGGWVHFMANEKDPRERHLYKVRLDGTGFARVTGAGGWHETHVAPGGASFVDVFSTPITPPMATLRDGSDRPLATLDDAEAKRVAGMRLAQVETHSVRAADGAILPALLMKPTSFDPSRRHPVLVVVYGGPHVQLVTQGWGRGLWNHRMADSGILIWMLDNRGAAGRGHAWETPIDLHMGRRELADQLDGVAYLKTLPGVDPGRIGIWGWSYGGYMTLYALTRAPGTFRMGVSVAPVTDWKNYDTIYTERYMGRPAANEEGYRESAPLAKAAELKDPLLLVHGTADDNVHMQNSVQMLDALCSAKVPVEFMLYPGKGHGITGASARMHLYGKIEAFIREHL